MKVGAHHYHTIWLNPDGLSVDIIDQRWLPHEFRVVTLKTVEDVATAIRDMWVRGAPLIGVTAAYGVAIAMAGDASNAALDKAWETLHVTRPTAINLKWALDDMRGFLRGLPEARRQEAAYGRAAAIAEEDVLLNRAIGAAWPCRDQADRRPQEAGRAGECAHPLQCRLARHRGLRHRDGADLSGQRRRHSGSCLCR